MNLLTTELQKENDYEEYTKEDFKRKNVHFQKKKIPKEDQEIKVEFENEEIDIFDPEFNDIDIDNMDQMNEEFNFITQEKEVHNAQQEKEKKKIILPNQDPRLQEFSIEDQTYLNKFDFKNSAITNDEKIRLFKILCKNKDLYSQTKYDIGCIRQEFQIKLQKDAILKKQRPSRIKLNYQEKLDTLIKNLIEAKIIKEMGNENDEEMGTAFINPVILIPKGEVLKLVLDARFLNSCTDLTTYSWPLEPLQCLTDRSEEHTSELQSP